MAIYRISGIWKDSSNEITHYAFHQVLEKGTGFAAKMTKSQAVSLLETSGNSATTWLWDYKAAKWMVGSSVHVVNRNGNKFLRSNHDNTERDNLNHIIDYDWLRTLLK